MHTHSQPKVCIAWSDVTNKYLDRVDKVAQAHLSQTIQSLRLQSPLFRS